MGSVVTFTVYLMCAWWKGNIYETSLFLPLSFILSLYLISPSHTQFLPHFFQQNLNRLKLKLLR